MQPPQRTQPGTLGSGTGKIGIGHAFVRVAEKDTDFCRVKRRAHTHALADAAQRVFTFHERGVRRHAEHFTRGLKVGRELA